MMQIVKILFPLLILANICVNASGVKINNEKLLNNSHDLEKTRQERRQREKYMEMMLDCSCKFTQLTLDLVNCILPGYVFVDKAIILAWSRITVDRLPYMNRLLPKLLVSIVFMIANSVMVHESIYQLQDLKAIFGEGGVEMGENVGENLEFQISLYPNSNGKRALIIVFPVFHFIVQNISDGMNSMSKKPETPLWAQLCDAVLQVPNIFLPAFLPPQLFNPMFGLAIARTTLAGGLDGTVMLFMFNIFAYCQWHLSEMAEGQLEKSSILFGVWFLFVLCLACFKKPTK